MQDGRKAVWSILYVSVAFFPSLKQNFIAYRSSNVDVSTKKVWKLIEGTTYVTRNLNSVSFSI